MLDLRLEEHPAPTGSRDPDKLLAWLLDSLGLVRRRNEAWGDEANQRPLQRLMRDHLLADAGAGWDAATLADDLGIGDLGCYNPASKVPTPHMGRLAREGIRFTDAHSPSAVCTPPL